MAKETLVSKTKLGIFDIVGILLSFLSLYVAVTQFINGNILNFLVAVIAGLIIMPFVWKQIETKLPFSLSNPLRITLWIILMVATIYLSV
jgi:hypothetical protein